MTHDHVLIRPLRDADRGAVARFIEAEWGALVMVVHGTVFHPAELPGFIAEVPGQDGGRPAGLLTYALAERGEGEVGGALEIVTLDAVRRLAGTGTALLGYAVTEAGTGAAGKSG
jgi:hypothetical protein